MDFDIEKINKFLEDGYAISSHQTTWGKKDNPEFFEHVVTLKKREKIEIVRSINSQEFADFMYHFVQCVDKFDNRDFVYIKDIDQFNKMRDKSHSNLPLQKDRHQIKISGRLFSKDILSNIIELKGKSSIKTVGSFWIDLETNKEFRDVDFKDSVEILDDKSKVIFRGFVKNYQYTKKYGIIDLQDFTLILENERVTTEFINMSPADSLALLTQSSGLIFNPPPGMPYNQNERDFIVIIPIQNLIIDSSFKIGNVEFYQLFDGMDDSIIRKSSNGRDNSLWCGNNPRAKTIIKSSNFFDAITKGYAVISMAIDVISLRTDISFPSITIHQCQYNFQFSYYKFLSKVKIPTIVYCREMNSHAATFFDIETIRENILSLNIDSQQYFEEVNALCSELILKNELTKEEENHLLVLHWLRKAIQEGDNKDKFLDLWIAFEFLISGEPSEIIFLKDDKKKLKNLIMSSKFTVNQKRAILSKTNMINESPLMEKFNQLIQKLGISFSDEEIQALREIRKKRTNLIHGNGDISLSDNELNKMRTILEKIFIGKINSSKCHV
ncbi:MAG: HEPN domain-containing protein [Methanoregula sp.]|nr:HEPN domain-containing protein [Methanoregula sp.]